jgi:hypothetical protein
MSHPHGGTAPWLQQSVRLTRCSVLQHAHCVISSGDSGRYGNCDPVKIAIRSQKGFVRAQRLRRD